MTAHDKKNQIKSSKSQNYGDGLNQSNAICHFALLFSTSNISKINIEDKQTTGNNCQGEIKAKFFRTNHSASSKIEREVLTKITAIIMPQQKEDSNSQAVLGLRKKGETMPAVNQATAQLVKNSAKALSWEEFNFLTKKTISQSRMRCQSNGGLKEERNK